ncbi:MAG: CHAT domain-containing protein [Saprospiraceae bacterium]|nr:CHAT domain-containing protein [Saprospiraceae bacterium]
MELEKEKYLYDPAFADNRIPLDSLNILIFQKKELFNRVLRDIRQNYSKYYELRYENPIPSVPEIQQTLLDTSQTLVEYFVGSNINIFILNRDRFDVIQVPRYTDFEILLDTIIPLIRRFRSESTAKLKQNSEAYAAAAYRLYQYLIAPLEDLIKRQLIVVPDDRLGYLPFDALLTAKVDSVMNFREHPYLIRRHSISYNFSASILAEMSQGSSDGYSNQYVGFAPEFDGMESQGLHKLLFNEQEIEKASDLLNGEIFVGKEATKNNFLRVQREYGVIHLDTHGKVNVGDDDFSFLAFSKGSASQEEDYLLYLKEIYNLQMQARMVILSACETGTGHLFRGEGISSIARGFSYAGARSLVATRWSVNDKTTSQLVETFLNEIKQGRQKDLALRSAILNYIDRQNSFYAHPFFWSSFMLMGDSEVLELDEGLPWKRILLMALGIIIILYLLKSISKNKRGF